MPEFINNQTPIDSILETNRNQDPYLDELKSHIENGNIPENTTLHKAAAKMLLEAGVIIDKPTLPTSRLENQTELDIDKLINKIENNEDYMFDSKEAKKLIETGNLELFYENIEKFKNLDENFANHLIDVDLGELVAQRLDCFHGLNYVDIANRLIETGKGWYVASSLDEFHGLNHIDIANHLINVGDCEYVADYLDKFQGLDHSFIANQLIQEDHTWDLLNNLNKFRNLNASIANNLIDEDGCLEVINNLGSFQCQQHIANKLIDKGEDLAKELLEILDEFQGLDHVDIANRLIDSGQGDLVASYLDKFHGLDYMNIASKLIIKTVRL